MVSTDLSGCAAGSLPLFCEQFLVVGEAEQFVCFAPYDGSDIFSCSWVGVTECVLDFLDLHVHEANAYGIATAGMSDLHQVVDHLQCLGTLPPLASTLVQPLLQHAEDGFEAFAALVRCSGELTKLCACGSPCFRRRGFAHLGLDRMCPSDFRFESSRSLRSFGRSAVNHALSCSCALRLPLRRRPTVLDASFGPRGRVANASAPPSAWCSEICAPMGTRKRRSCGISKLEAAMAEAS